MNPEATPGLYKTKLDNSETVLVTEDLGLFLIVDGDWIYYSSITQDDNDAIYKVKTDGTKKIKLIDDSIMASMAGKGFELDGDWLYYLSMSDEGSLYRVKTDNKDSEKLMEKTYNFSIKDDWIYYSAGNDLKIYKMKKDGSQNKLILEENAIVLYISDGFIYFSDESGNNLKRSNLEGSNVEELNINNIYLLSAKDDLIYYITKPAIPEPDTQLNKVKAGESEIFNLTEDDSFFMEVAGDWIYYISIDVPSDSFKLNKIKSDGSTKETFKAEGFFVFLNW